MDFVMTMGKKKNIAFSAAGVCFVTYVYFAYFYIHDPNEVLRANRQLHQQRAMKQLSDLPSPEAGGYLATTSRQAGGENITHKRQPMKIQSVLNATAISRSTKYKYKHYSANSKRKTLVTFPEYPNASEVEIQQNQESVWRSWLAKNGYISVGEYFNHCGPIMIVKLPALPLSGNNRIVIGQFVIVHDEGGIKFKTFINTTWTQTVATGTIHVHVSYAGIPIIKLAQDICKSTRKAFKCPLQEGFNTMSIDFKLPFFVPKGRYHMQAWGQNKQGYVLACLITEVII